MSTPTETFGRAVDAHRRGELERADGLYRRILSKSPRHAGALMQLGLIEQTRGRLGEARTLIEKAGRIEPDNPTVRNSLGQILLAQEHHDAAVAEFRAAVASEPKYAPAWHNLGLAQAMRGDFPAAVESFRRALASGQPDPQLLLNLGQALGETGAFDDAVEVLLQAIRLQPAVPQIRLALGDVLMHAGDAAKAIHQYREVERLVPGNPVGPHRIGMALQQIGDIEASIVALDRSLKLAPGSASIQCDLANAHAMAGDYGGARKLFGDVAKLSDQASVIGVAVRGLVAAGDAAQGREVIAPLVASANADPEVAVAMADLAADRTAVDQAKERLESALEIASPTQRPTVLFALAEMEHRRGDFDRAFARATEANALKNARFDAAAETALVDRVIEATRGQFPGVPAESAREAPTLVFVVGMQRAGLRLVDAILTEHPDVASLGAAGAFQATVNTIGNGGFGYLDRWSDLTDDELASTAAVHLEQVLARAATAPTVVEAIPGNLFHLGLIRRMFPDARFVLCQRAPLDRCLSCYFQDFAGASPYAYDLESLAHHSRSVDRLADHWRVEFGDSIVEVSFEGLLEEPEETVRTLLRDLGLAWHASCSKLIDSERAKRRKRHPDYHHFLNPLISGMDPREG